MARSRVEEIRLEAIAAAKRLHRDMKLRDVAISGVGLVDVFGVIVDLGIPLVFKPLNSALGLCLPKPLSGIMVTTERSLHIQRFTAAHELGHAVLEHSGSIDREVNYRTMFEPDDDQDLQEVAADAFAAEFMLPRWLYKHHIRQQGWSVQRHLQIPEIVYQLSLRMGASYEATCWGLLNHKILNYAEVKVLVKKSVADIKHNTGVNFRPANAWANTWRISSKDDGTTLVADQDDLLRIDLDEAAGNGFQWNLDDLKEAGFEILSDQNEVVPDPVIYGGTVRRTLVARPPQEEPVATLELAESQPWLDSNDHDRHMQVALNLTSKEPGGLSRTARIKCGALVT